MQNTIDLPGSRIRPPASDPRDLPHQQKRVVGGLPQWRLPQAREARAAHVSVACRGHPRPYGTHQHGEHRL